MLLGVTVRTEEDPMGMGGHAWYAASPEDIAHLPPTAAALVPRQVAELFAALPGSLLGLAARAPLPAMKRFLEGLVGAPCELEVYATAVFGREARLRFHLDDVWRPSIRAVAGKPRLPCAEVLHRVHAITGHIDTQYGGSGTLVALDELRTLRELCDEQAVMNFAEIGAALDRQPALGAYVGVYEVDGDWLCASSGRAIWAGGELLADHIVPAGEDLASQALREASLATLLDAYFQALVERRVFGPGL
jgi:hypothetical protein